jgi:hypothetical protein
MVTLVQQVEVIVAPVGATEVMQKQHIQKPVSINGSAVAVAAVIPAKEERQKLLKVCIIQVMEYCQEMERVQDVLVAAVQVIQHQDIKVLAKMLLAEPAAEQVFLLAKQ